MQGYIKKKRKIDVKKPIRTIFKALVPTNISNKFKLRIFNDEENEIGDNVRFLFRAFSSSTLQLFRSTQCYHLGSVEDVSVAPGNKMQIPSERHISL